MMMFESLRAGPDRPAGKRTRIPDLLMTVTSERCACVSQLGHEPSRDQRRGESFLSDARARLLVTPR
jgi:hypothetical protein